MHVYPETFPFKETQLCHGLKLWEVQYLCWRLSLIKKIDFRVRNFAEADSKGIYDNPSRTTEVSHEETCSLHKGLSLLAPCKKRETKWCLTMEAPNMGASLAVTAATYA